MGVAFGSSIPSVGSGYARPGFPASRARGPQRDQIQELARRGPGRLQLEQAPQAAVPPGPRVEGAADPVSQVQCLSLKTLLIVY